MLESPWASRRREDLLQLLDRLNPRIADLTQVIEQEVEKCPEARRLRTHPGVGALTALAFVSSQGRSDFSAKQIAACLGFVPLEDSNGNRRRTGPYHEAREFDVALFAGGSGPSYIPEWRNKHFRLAMRPRRKIAKVAMVGSQGQPGNRDGVK
ncbi:MAG: transposase [Candidatus Sulfotelmatobacter sp.]